MGPITLLGRRAPARAAGWLLPLVLALSGCCTQGPEETSAGPAVVAAPAAPAHDESESESDRIVTERIRTVFREDSEIAGVAPRVGIATRRGVVTLTGSVETDRQRRVMAAHARATDGAASVDDQLQLVP